MVLVLIVVVVVVVLVVMVVVVRLALLSANPVVAMVVVGSGIRNIKHRKRHKTGVCHDRVCPKGGHGPGPPRHRRLLLGGKSKLPEDTAESMRLSK